MECAAEEAKSRIKEAYERAVGARRKPVSEDVLYLAARARSDESEPRRGRVAAAAGADGGETALLAMQVPLKTRPSRERGAVLRRNGRH